VPQEGISGTSLCFPFPPPPLWVQHIDGQPADGHSARLAGRPPTPAGSVSRRVSEGPHLELLPGKEAAA